MDIILSAGTYHLSESVTFKPITYQATPTLKLEPLTDEEIEEHLYKLSTSPESYAFTKDDGTLVNPNVYSHVRIRPLLQAQLDKIKQNNPEMRVE